MKKVSSSTMRVLKIAHILGAILWTGGIICMLVVLISSSLQTSSDVVLSQLALLRTFDYFVIIPGVSLCLALGFIYGFFTHWGFASYKWVLLKWILFLVACIPAALVFLPLLDSMQELVVLYGLDALGMPDYTTSNLILVTMVSVQIILSFIMIGISVLKPFKKKKQLRNQRKITLPR